jgi:V/A-type H+-transporting ATPase subunit E
MALENILEAIRAESDRTAAEILADAEAGANRLLERASEEAEREEQQLSTSLDDQARLERSRIVSRAHVEAATERREAREQAYLAARDGATRQVEALRSSPEYEKVLADLLDEALAVLPGVTVVRVDPTDVPMAERLLTDRDLEIHIEPEAFALGGVVVAAEGRSVDNSVRSRLDRADEHLRFIAGELAPGLRGGMG